MAFTGKATYSAEDVSDLIGIISPYETPLLDAIGNPLREAKSTYHEWLEDSLVPNKDTISDSSISNPASETSFDVAHGDRFRAGDQIQTDGSEELILVTGVSSNTITVVRGYAGTTPENIVCAAGITRRFSRPVLKSAVQMSLRAILVFQMRWIIRRPKDCAS